MTRIKIKRKNKINIHETNNPLAVASPLAKLRLALLYSFPAVLYFSYYPILPLGSNSSMNFELSLPLIWLFLFTLLSLKDFYLFLKPLSIPKNSISNFRLFLLSILLSSLYLSLSVLWSPNPLRGVLTVGILWCILISLVSIKSLFESSLIKKFLLRKIFLISSVFVCLVCWFQCFLDVFGVPRETTLLCLGCTSRMFGFPHPSGFAIEPQFMGNLLLAPTFYIIYIYNKTEQNVKNRTSPLLLFIFASTLFLTFSRGAIYAFGVGFLFFAFYSLSKKLLPLDSLLKSAALLVFSFLFTLSMQGIFSELSMTNDTFFSGVQKSLNQLSLGLIDFREKSSESKIPPVSSPNESSEETSNNLLEESENPENFSVFDGYVAESTNFRLDLNVSALSASLDSPVNFLFGYGLGSAGTVLHEKGFTTHPKEIVQNEYFSLLLETGLLGLLLFLLVIIVFFTTIAKTNAKTYKRALSLKGLFLVSLTLSYLITLSFFSGFPNVLHLYLLPPLFLFSSQTQSDRKLKS